MYSLPHVSQVYAIYLAQMTSAHFDAGIESLECKFFDVNEIPWDEIAFTAVTFGLKKYVENLGKKSNETFIGHLEKLKK